MNERVGILNSLSTIGKIRQEMKNVLLKKLTGFDNCIAEHYLTLKGKPFWCKLSYFKTIEEDRLVVIVFMRPILLL